MSIATVTSRHSVIVATRTLANGVNMGNNNVYSYAAVDGPRTLTCTVVPARGAVRDMLMMRGADRPHTIYFAADPLLREDDRLKWTLTGEFFRVMIPAFNAHGQNRLYIVGCNMLAVDNPG